MSKPTITTVKEFKAWLEGIEQVQDKKWVPNAKQWKLIRDKINSISEVEYQQHRFEQYPVNYASNNSLEQPIHTTLIPSSVQNFKPSMPVDALGRPLGNLKVNDSGGLKTPDGQETIFKTGSTFE